MYCHTLKLLAVSLAVASANGTSDESATTNNTGGGGARRLVPAAAANDNRRRRQRTGGLSVTPSNYESVSETPLTFEYVETYPDIDRERILAEAEIRGEDWDEEVETETEMVEEQAVEEGEDEGVFIHEDEDAVDVEFMDLEEYIGVDGEDDEEQYSPDETEYEFVYTDMEPDVVPYTTTTWTESSSDVDAGANDMDFYDEIEERDIVIKPEEEEEMDGEGSMEVDHEPLLFETKDIRRRLRRLDAPVIVSEENEDDMERYLADKESLRDDTLAIVSCAVLLVMFHIMFSVFVRKYLTKSLTSHHIHLPLLSSLIPPSMPMANLIFTTRISTILKTSSLMKVTTENFNQAAVATRNVPRYKSRLI